MGFGGEDGCHIGKKRLLYADLERNEGGGHATYCTYVSIAGNSAEEMALSFLSRADPTGYPIETLANEVAIEFSGEREMGFLV